MSSPNPFTLKQSKFSNQSNTLINLEASFLDLKSQIKLNKTCRAVYLVISPKFKRLKAAKLLDHVLNIDEKRKKEIIALLKSPDVGPLSSMLIPASGQVRYHSSKKGNKIVPRIHVDNLSPLQAAAMCGDFHLVKLFERALPPRQKHGAGLQLLAVITDSNFLSAFKRLQSAYQIYFRYFNELEAKSDWNTINALWGQIGKAQKHLSNFGLNVFCNLIPHVPLPDFTKEPQRAIKIKSLSGSHPKIVDLDLDSLGAEHLGLDNNWGLFKGDRNDCIAAEGWEWYCKSRKQGEIDSRAIDFLCKVMTTELGNITERLLSYPPQQEQEQDVSAERSVVARDLDSSKSRCVVS